MVEGRRRHHHETSPLEALLPDVLVRGVPSLTIMRTVGLDHQPGRLAEEVRDTQLEPRASEIGALTTRPVRSASRSWA